MELRKTEFDEAVDAGFDSDNTRLSMTRHICQQRVQRSALGIIGISTYPQLFPQDLSQFAFFSRFLWNELHVFVELCNSCSSLEPSVSTRRFSVNPSLGFRDP